MNFIYPITIKETLVKTIDIHANSAEEAKEICKKRYNNRKEGYILTTNDFNEVEFLTESEVFNNIK